MYIYDREMKMYSTVQMTQKTFNRSEWAVKRCSINYLLPTYFVTAASPEKSQGLKLCLSLYLFSSCAFCLSGAHRRIPSSSRTSNPGRGAKKRQRRSIWRAHGNTVSHCACCLMYRTDPAVCVATAFPQLHAPPPLLVAVLLPSALFPDPLITLSHQTDTHSLAHTVWHLWSACSEIQREQGTEWAAC